MLIYIAKVWSVLRFIKRNPSLIKKQEKIIRKALLILFFSLARKKTI